MKLNNHGPHDHSEEKGLKNLPKRVKQYLQDVYHSVKYKKLSHGSADIVRSMSWARGENWRRTHPKSLNKHHK